MSELLLGKTIGVEVTVCVTILPETVTTRTLVTGDGVMDGVIELLGSSVVAGTGATTAMVVLLEVGATYVDVLDDVKVVGGSELDVEAGVCIETNVS